MSLKSERATKFVGGALNHTNNHTQQFVNINPTSVTDDSMVTIFSTTKIDRKNKILYGFPEPQDYTEGTNSLGELCLKNLAANPNYVVLIDAITSEELTASALRSAAIRVATCLRKQGIVAGDKVAIYSENRMEFVYVMFGTFLLGATAVPINWTYTENELEHAVKLARPKIIFVSSATVANATATAKRCAFFERVVVFGEHTKESNENGLVVGYHSFVTADISAEGSFRCEPQNMDENIALILYSSGTTGLPKGVQLSQKNVMYTREQYKFYPNHKLDAMIETAITLSVGPWSHAFGCLALIRMPLDTNRMVFLPKFVDVNFLSSIEKFRVNTLHVVPPLMMFLAKSPIVTQYDLSSLKIVYCGAAPLSRELEQAVQDRLNIPFVRQGYGMTEATVGLTSQTDDYMKRGSVGGIRAGTRGRIIDENGSNLGPNMPGELLFAGPTIMKGYIGDKVATNSTVDSDGWLHTGDIGYYDEDGEIFIVDRLKELIKYNGFQVPPAEIEGILQQHQEIADAGVIGVPDDRSGELPMAFVVRANGSQISEKAICDFVAGKASPAKRLHGGVRFVAAIPRNPSGKILRKELRLLFKKTLSKL